MRNGAAPYATLVCGLPADAIGAGSCGTSAAVPAMAKYTGLPFTAIPVFLHRRFRHGFIFLNTSKGIRKPADLIDRRIGLRNFQATANLWIRGILEHEHGLPHRSVHWFKQDEEEVDWTPPGDLDIQRIPPGKSVEKMLVEGELDALIHPEIIQPILDKDQRVSRLFPHYRELEIDYYKRTRIFPIMVLRRSTIL